jgi:hypothetical protein
MKPAGMVQPYIKEGLLKVNPPVNQGLSYFRFPFLFLRESFATNPI